MYQLFKITHFREIYNPETGSYYLGYGNHSYVWIGDEQYGAFEQWSGDMAPDVTTEKICEVASEHDIFKIRDAPL